MSKVVSCSLLGRRRVDEAWPVLNWEDLPVGPDARLTEAVSAVMVSTGIAAVPSAVAMRAPDGTHAVCLCGPPEIDGPVTGATVMYGASLAKQVVGILVSLAVQAGELDLDQPLRQFLPWFPPWANQVRVRHLLHHTSGLPAAVASLALLHHVGQPSGYGSASAHESPEHTTGNVVRV